MATGYTRQEDANIVTGAVIQDTHLDNEFDQVEAAFHATTGHDHSAGAGLGPLISLAGGSIGITGTLAVGNGGIGATTLTDGGILLGSGASAVTAMAALADGSIVVGDGATDPVALAAFTSSTGTLKHESGGLEFDANAIADGGMIVGTASGTMAIRASALTAGAAGFIKHELGGMEFDLSAIVQGDVVAGSGTGTAAIVKSIYGRNAIINGDMDIWQRGTSFTAVANNTVTADRWKWKHTGAGVVTIDEGEAGPDGTSPNPLRIDVTTVDSSIAAADIYRVEYKVEGNDATRFGFGTSDAKALSLSFWMRSTITGIHCIAFQNSANNRSYIIEYTVNAIDTWEYKTMTLTADTTGTWLYDSGVGLGISFILAAGTDNHGAADTWLATSDRATSNQVNVMDNTSNFFQLARVQLEIGSVATEFERRSWRQELSDCQRYYAKTFPYGTAPAQNAGLDGSISYRCDRATAVADGVSINFPVVMRATPTFTFYNPSAANALWRNNTDPGDSGAASTANTSDKGFFAGNAQAANDGTAELLSVHYQADAEL